VEDTPVGGVTVARLPVPASIRDAGVIAIGRRLNPAGVVAIADALARGGVGAFEITLDGDGSLESLGRLTDRFADSAMLIGAGTILHRDAADAAISAGARFLVMPHLDETLIRIALDAAIPVFPGAFSPSEILAAWRAGATAVKLFPASAAGATFVRELRGPFPDIGLIPTGGVTIESAPGFIAAGAVAVGLGGSLVGGGQPDVIERRARALVTAIAAVRSDGAQ
jgi:2-dehydro-3-deoxyphosphogluconate aldolase / (4S)-4-hydroxy-2-oxoglutarate aldolase